MSRLADRPPTACKADADRAVRIILQSVSDAHGISLREWATRKGYQPANVYAVIRRWGYRLDQQPHGGLARAIVADLRRALPQSALDQITRPAAHRRAA
jgi:hypothetical protein